MSLEENELQILVGSIRSFEVLLTDEDGVAEDLTNADAATVSIKEDVDNASDILLRKTGDSTLVIDKVNSLLKCVFASQAEADALVAGTYIGQATVRIDGTNWTPTDPFRVTILKSFAPNTAV